MSECKANETAACCCVDVGTIIDNSDCAVDFTQVYETREQAEEAVSYLTKKAKEAETDPCRIQSEIKPVDNGFEVTARFEFSCQAESMIFQLSTR